LDLVKKDVQLASDHACQISGRVDCLSLVLRRAGGRGKAGRGFYGAVTIALIAGVCGGLNILSLTRMGVSGRRTIRASSRLPVQKSSSAFAHTSVAAIQARHPGSGGAEQRAVKLTPEERSALAKKAAAAPWNACCRMENA
jgi:hypothetical protein